MHGHPCSRREIHSLIHRTGLSASCNQSCRSSGRDAFRRAVAVLLLVLTVVGFPPSPAIAATDAPTVTIVVNTILDGPVAADGLCALREAVEAANTNKAVGGCPAGSASVVDRINFNIAGGGNIQTITLSAGPLNLTSAILIDGTSQSCPSGPCIELKGSPLTQTGLLLSGGNQSVQGLILNNFSTAAIHITGGGFHAILSNYIGTDSAGTNAVGNGIGILVEGSNGHLIGRINQGNIISGNQRGVVLRSDENRVFANRIGTGKTGTEKLGNSVAGIHIDGGKGNTIGDGLSDSSNVIANNAIGIHISGSDASNNKIFRNRIGIDQVLQTDMGNTTGIRISGGASNNFIGSVKTDTGNVIAYGDTGILITGNNTRSNKVLRNTIGTTGENPDLGMSTGILITDRATSNQIGDIDSGNVIAHNDTAIQISGAGTNGNRVEGNRIGIGTGNLDLGNVNGIRILEGASNNLIGGPSEGQGNIIGHGDNAIEIAGAATTGNTVQGNTIGTDMAGAVDLGNSVDGVLIGGGASNNTIGGTNFGEGNVIAFNGGVGVLVTGNSAQNRILGNRIFANGSLGIDLSAQNNAADGVTANDAGDPDASANLFQNYPILNLAVGLETLTTAIFTLNSTPATPFRIEFFANSSADPSGNGEGQTYIGFQDVTTDNNGNVTIAAGLAHFTGEMLTATATDPNGNTSEFSKAVAITPIRTCVFADLLAQGDWNVGENWTCDQKAALPDKSTRTVIGSDGDTQFAQVLPGNQALANDIQIGSFSGLTVRGDLNATMVENNGTLAILGNAVTDLSLVNQAGSTLSLGAPDGTTGTATVRGDSTLAGTLAGNGTLDLSAARTTSLTSVLSPGFAGDLSQEDALADDAPVIGKLTLVGDTSLISATVKLDIVGPAAYDALSIVGAGVLGGALNLRIARIAPEAVGGAYPIVTCSEGCSGEFATVLTPDGVVADLEYREDSVVLNLTSPAIFLPITATRK